MAIPGLDPAIVPAIYVLLAELPQERRGCRDNPWIKSGDGHYGEEAIPSHRNAL